jgi:short-subunit dehydrogenase
MSTGKNSAGVCVVVGTGPGIGQAVAKRFGRAGYSLGLIARKKESLDGFVAGMKTVDVDAAAFVADAEHAPSLVDALTQVHNELGAVDVLVYNAAVLKRGSPFDIGVERLVREFRVNVGGALVCAQQVVPAMKAKKRGTILLTGGGLALDPWPAMASLAIGKAGLRNLALSLHKELKESGVRVATVTVDGLVKAGAGALDPAAIAEVFWSLHDQPAATGEPERVIK